MKKQLLCLAFSFLLLLSPGCSVTSRPDHDPMPSDTAVCLYQRQDEYFQGQNGWKVTVNGKSISAAATEYNAAHGYILLPLTAILKELGAEITWSNETNATIVFNGRAYILNTNEPFFSSKGNSGPEANQFEIPPGANHEIVFLTLDRELMIDNDSCSSVLCLTMKCQVAVDPEKQLVCINFRQASIQ